MFFNNGMRFFNLPYTKLKCCFTTHTEFWQECFVFCSTINYVHVWFKMYHPIISVNALHNLQSVRPWNSLLSATFFSRNFPHAWLWYIKLVANLMCWLSLDQADKSTDHNQLLLHLNMISLKSSCYWCNLCPQLFVPLSDQICGWRIQLSFLLHAH